MISRDNIPQHIAIIMDGNGRWAKEHYLPRAAGHREGTKRVKEIIKAAAELGVKVLTLFAFSTENWSRPRKEIAVLMRYLDDFLDREVKELDINNIRFKVIGQAEPIPKNIIRKIRQAENKTKDNSGLLLVLALNYGSRQEITEAAKRFCRDVLAGKENPENLSPETFGRYLYTADIPEPDLLIRTSAEMRLSNFLLWQLSYAELYFPEKHWPDFKRRELEEAIEAFQSRDRRFGGL